MPDDYFTLKEMLEKIDGKTDKLLDNFSNLQAKISVAETKIDNNCDDIQKLKEKSNTWDLLNSVGIAIATAIGFIRGVS